jgi:hypothetical protein
MQQHIDSLFSTAFRCFMAKICISLFFLVLASKSPQSLITDYATETNRIQREFDSNVAIATQEFASASKPSRQKNKPFQT